jgi:hypothetical protein
MAKPITGPLKRANGKFFRTRRELFEDESTAQAIRDSAKVTEEETYQDSLDIGLPRDPAVEKTLDMSKINLP